MRGHPAIGRSPAHQQLVDYITNGPDYPGKADTLSFLTAPPAPLPPAICQCGHGTRDHYTEADDHPCRACGCLAYEGNTAA